MIIEFLAIIVAGFGGAGTVLILRKLTGRLLPEWLLPVGIAGGMLAMVIYLEYSWAERFQAGLPDDVHVAAKNQSQIWYRPWTYVVPLTTRIVLVDNRVRQWNRANPQMVITGIILQERWALRFGFKSLFDCAQALRADLTEGMELGEDALPLNAEWYQLSAEDPFLKFACEGGTHGRGDEGN